MKLGLLSLVSLVLNIGCGNYSTIDTEYWAKPQRHLRVYAKELADQNNLSLLGTSTSILLEETVLFTQAAEGGPVTIYPDHTDWVLNLTASRRTTLAEAKPFARQLAESLWEKVEDDPAFAYNVEVRSGKFPYDPKQLYPTSVGFKLAFWDDNIERYEYPYLAQIRLVDGYLLYFYAEGKLGPLKPPIVEPIFPRELDENESSKSSNKQVLLPID